MLERTKIQFSLKYKHFDVIKIQIFGKSCHGYLLSEDADNWITGYIRHHHGNVDWSGKEHKMQVIFHPSDEKTQVPDRVRKL